MKRFEFSLEALLEMRKHEEEAVKLELADKNRELVLAQNELLDFERELKELQDLQKRQCENVTDVQPLKWSVSYRNKLKLDMIKKGRTIHKMQMDRVNIRKKLIKATQKKKAIELLRENRYQKWLKENKHSEQVFLDDVSQQGFIRKKKSEKNKKSSAA